MLLYLCGDYFMNPVLFIFLYFVLSYLCSSFHISDKLCIFLGIIILYVDVKMSERYIEDNSYDSKKHICRHIRHAKFHFSTFMISVVFVIYIILSFSLVSPNKKGQSYVQGIECCNKNNGTIEGNYCILDYHTKVLLNELGNETSVEYKAYCLKNIELLKELNPYDWQKYVAEE